MRTAFNRALSAALILLVLTGLLTPLAKAEGLILSLDGLLPSKSDDPKSYPVLQEPIWYFGITWSENLSAPGFVDGRGVEYYKRFYEHSDMSVEFYAFLFSNVSSAEAYYSREINQTKSNGGYAEVTISGAFAVVYDYGTQEIGVSWGVISNVVFKVAVYTANIVEDPTDQLVSFTVLERARILEKDPNTIPELPNVIAIPVFVIATLIAVKIGRKISKKNYSSRWATKEVAVSRFFCPENGRFRHNHS